MSSDGWLALGIALVALLILAVAALVQMVVGQSNRSRVQSALGQAPDVPGRQRNRSGTDPRNRLVSTMVLIQVISAIFAAGLLTRVFDQLIGSKADWLAIAIVVVVYLIFGQIVPRSADKAGFDPYVDRIINLGQAASTLVAPVTWVIETGVRRMRPLLPGSSEGTLYDVFEETGANPEGLDLDEVGDVERQMIQGIMGLESTNVREIMVPRLDIVAVDRSVPPQELIETITRAGHSRIPVYKESIDNILGVLYAKDLLPFVIGTTQRIPLLDLIRPAFVVPESKQVNDLFAELKRTQIHLAIVADEYGGTAGLVTIEDILEEIVGEIQDEYDSEVPLFELISDDMLLADGRLPIEDVEDALNIRFEEDDDFGTLGGFVHKHLGRLPIQGDVFEAEGVRVEIIAVERHRVRQLRLTRLRSDDLASQSASSPDGDDQERSRPAADARDDG